MNFNTRPFRWLTILIFLFAVAITTSEKGYGSKIFAQSKVTDCLGELSLGLYLIHYPIRRIFLAIWAEPNEMFRQKWLYAVVTFVMANVFLLSVKYARKTCVYIAGWAKMKLLQAD